MWKTLPYFSFEVDNLGDKRHINSSLLIIHWVPFETEGCKSPAFHSEKGGMCLSWKPIKRVKEFILYLLQSSSHNAKTFRNFKRKTTSRIPAMKWTDCNSCTTFVLGNSETNSILTWRRPSRWITHTKRTTKRPSDTKLFYLEIKRYL
jgi:hypothetical protein